jgi:hypothetical protein
MSSLRAEIFGDNLPIAGGNFVDRAN